jgi:hypothetical protein
MNLSAGSSGVRDPPKVHLKILPASDWDSVTSSEHDEHIVGVKLAAVGSPSRVAIPDGGVAIDAVMTGIEIADQMPDAGQELLVTTRTTSSSMGASIASDPASPTVGWSQDANQRMLQVSPWIGRADRSSASPRGIRIEATRRRPALRSDGAPSVCLRVKTRLRSHLTQGRWSVQTPQEFVECNQANPASARGPTAPASCRTLNAPALQRLA